MRTLLAITLIATLTLAVALPLCAEVYVVDGATGDDGRTMASPRRSDDRRGANAVGPGDTLRIVPMDEPYREGLRMDRHGLRGAPIVIEGGGAVLCGADPVPDEGWTEQDGIWQVPLAAHDRMMLFGKERLFIKGAGPTTLEPEQWRWAEGTLYFRPAEGKTPRGLEWSRPSIARGLLDQRRRADHRRDLTCVNFLNDGFNLQCAGRLWFETSSQLTTARLQRHETEVYVRAPGSTQLLARINDIIFSRYALRGRHCPRQSLDRACASTAGCTR